MSIAKSRETAEPSPCIFPSGRLNSGSWRNGERNYEDIPSHR
ncbi:hypothetical protein SpAn4DRAFT_0324 [Sporomusa ovata]|uniref:Uncharacterized protein n=1 Tax=Sporomusa ovata TaxID=2378 RepID=A0A0U1L2H3_9FIRM|nr:hypothetical protein SpAn4DRAFT_0324 [Sporomusa ovata]